MQQKVWQAVIHAGQSGASQLAVLNVSALSCSATNYLLGVSSVPFKPFLAATFAAMAVWGPLYASIGAASRGVLKSRGDVGAIFSGKPPQSVSDHKIQASFHLCPSCTISLHPVSHVAGLLIVNGGLACSQTVVYGVFCSSLVVDVYFLQDPCSSVAFLLGQTIPLHGLRVNQLLACAELQARTGEYSEKGAEVALVAGLVVLGLWATGVLKTDGSDDPDAGRVERHSSK